MKILAIGVHTDDCEYGVGGTLKLLTDLGWEAEILNLCPYKFSPSPERDLAFSKEAAKLLGCNKVAEVPKTKDWWRNTGENAKRIESAQRVLHRGDLPCTAL